jgi:hypothetical protein
MNHDLSRPGHRPKNEFERTVFIIQGENVVVVDCPDTGSAKRICEFASDTNETTEVWFDFPLGSTQYYSPEAYGPDHELGKPFRDRKKTVAQRFKGWMKS